MISIIICSRKPSISSDLEENIKNTIGSEWELVVIDNSRNEFSIFEAYNIGIKKSKGEVLVFMHDDLKFKTPFWGKLVSEIFDANNDIGLIGVAGNTIKTKLPSPWWAGPGKRYNNIIQHYQSNIPSKHVLYGFNENSIAEVAVIDGVFMAMKRDDRIFFDERLSGFHNYDLDISLMHHILKKKVCVTNKILIEHFSGGDLNLDWYKTVDKFHRLNAGNLPVIKDSIILPESMKMHEFSTGAEFISKLMENGKKKKAFYWWLILLKMKPVSKYHFKFLKKFIFK